MGRINRNGSTFLKVKSGRIHSKPIKSRGFGERADSLAISLQLEDQQKFY